jgi:hypothetical protein
MTGRYRAAALLAGVGLALAPSRAQAGPLVEFDLPQQPLAQSLDIVGKRSRSNIFFSPDSVRGRIAPALKGRYGIDEALRNLLRGSGLRISVTAGGSYIIARPATDRAHRASAQRCRG